MSGAVYRFGPFRYDAGQRLLFRGNEVLPLVPKAIDTLHVLLERRGQVVEKSELMKLVWPDANVEDVGLARNISLLRKALADESEENPYIETIPRRGYRFAADASIAGPAGERCRLRPLRLWLVCGGLLAAGGLVYYLFYVPSRFVPEGNTAATMAVAPFDCLCPGMENFSQGLNEMVAAELSKLSGVQVISPGTVRRYQRSGVSMAVMGRLLGLSVIVEGTIQKLDKGIRITPRLVDVRTGKLIWSDTYDEPGDPGRAQEALAHAVAAEVGKRLTQRR